MKPRALPSIVEGELSDYHWTAVEQTPTPKKTQTAQPTAQTVAPEPTPTTPALPTMKIVPGPISYEELVKNLREYDEQLFKIPNWPALLEEKSKAAKEARKRARREARRKAAA